MPTPPDFPQISRKPALKGRRSTIDPTIRDNMANGMEATGVTFSRARRQFSVSIDALTPADVQVLEDFVDFTVLFGSKPFFFRDERDPKVPRVLQVKFSSLPSFTDAGNIEGEFRQNCTFELRTV